MIICNQCGKDNQDHFIFCQGCGTQLTSAAPANEQNVGTMNTMVADVGQGGRSPTPPGGMPGVSVASSLADAAIGTVADGATQAASPAAPAASVAAPAASVAAPAAAPTDAGATPAAKAHAPPAEVSAAAQAATAPLASDPAPSEQSKTCQACGTTVPEQFKFCGSCGAKMPEPEPAPAQPAPSQRTATMTLIRPDGSEGDQHNLTEGSNTIGRDYGALFENDGYLSPTHAEIVLDAEGILVRDLDSLNGIFLRLTSEELLTPGQVIRIGQELLRFNTLAEPKTIADGTEVMGSPNPGYWGKLTVIIGDGVDGFAYPLLGDSVTIGRERGDINFPDDGYVSGLHSRVFTRGGQVYVTDLGSSNGTFVKLEKERRLTADAYVLLGQQLFRVDVAK